MMDEAQYYGYEPELRSSGLGIASLILALASGLLFAAVIGWAVMKEVKDPGWLDRQNQNQNQNPQQPPAALVMIGMVTLVSIGGELIAIGLGIAGLCQSNRKKLLPILGLVFSAGPLLLILVLMMIGLAAGG